MFSSVFVVVLAPCQGTAREDDVGLLFYDKGASTNGYRSSADVHDDTPLAAALEEYGDAAAEGYGDDNDDDNDDGDYDDGGGGGRYSDDDGAHYKYDADGVAGAGAGAGASAFAGDADHADGSEDGEVANLYAHDDDTDDGQPVEAAASDEPLDWFYGDETGSLQGPFTATMMREWLAYDYFTVDTLVKHESMEELVAVGVLYKDGVEPFT